MSRESVISIESSWRLLGLAFLLFADHLAAASEFSNRPHKVGRIEITAATQSVGERVGYSPNLPNGGVATPSSQARYHARQVGIRWNIFENLSLHSSLSTLSFTSLRDQFELNRAEFKLIHAINHRNKLEFGVATNFQSSIQKNSFTSVGNSTITNISISNPRDLTIHTGFTRTLPWTQSKSVSIHSAVGFIKSTNDSVRGTIDQGNCQYKFNFNSSGGDITLMNSCGNIVALTRSYPSEQTIESDFGVSPASDTRFNAGFLKLGGELAFNHGKWHSTAALYHQYIDRGKFDRRISDQQQTGFQRNNTAFLSTIRHTDSGWAFSAKIEYQQRRFLDTVPVLYTRFTSRRFKNDVFFLSLGLHYHLN